jgi:hypothetical protein
MATDAEQSNAPSDRPGATPEIDRREPDRSRLRTLVQDSHLSLLIGAGTPSPYFATLGEIERVLTEIAHAGVDAKVRAHARASVQAHFFKECLRKNLELIDGDPAARRLLQSYGRLGRALNRLLLLRRSTLLDKRVSIFTTNVDLAFEVGFERAGLELNDGFYGRIDPTLDIGRYGALRIATSARYDRRSEIPSFDLVKLHGSVHWRHVPGELSTVAMQPNLEQLKAIEEAYGRAAGYLTTFDESSELTVETALEEAPGSEYGAAEAAAFTEAYDKLFIVNPEKSKFASTVLTETYYELIRRFANELERENSALLVHGFSFRDEHLRNLMLRAARTNPTLQVVVFSYTAAEEENMRVLLPDTAVPNRNIEFISDGVLTLDALVGQWLEPLIPMDAGSSTDV